MVGRRCEKVFSKVFPDFSILTRLERPMLKIVLPWPLASILLPITEWLPIYNWKDVGPSDLAAGLTVFVLIVPQGLAYALLAGLPPIYGLYSSILPVFIYAVFATSKQLSIGPMAITSLLLGVTAQTYDYDEQSPEYIKIVMNLSMLVGLCLFVLGLLRLGSLANLISESVLVGFVTAAALVIALNQIKYILGIDVPRFTYTHQTIVYLLTHLDRTNGNAASVGILSIAGLYGIREWKKNNKPTPDRMKSTLFKTLTVLSKMSNLLCIIMGSLIAYCIINGGTYIDIVGHVPSGMMAPSFQSVGFSETIKLIPASLAIAFVVFAGNWAVAKKYAYERNHEVDATQELLAVGLALWVSSFFNCFSGGGGLGRCAVNAESGAQTQMSCLIAAVLMLIAVLCLTSLFYYIPMCVLGAVIEVSVFSMIDFKSMVDAYKVQKRDCLVMVVTFLLTFFVGLIQGLFGGILISTMVVHYDIAFPYVAHIGKFPDEQGFYYQDISRYQETEQVPGVTVIRMVSTLFFANATHFKEIALRSATGEFHSSDEPIRKVIIDASCWIDIDLTGMRALFELEKALTKKGVILAIAGANGAVRDRLLASQFMAHSPQHYHYFSIHDAISEVDRCEASQLLCSMAADLVGDIEANPMHSPQLCEQEKLNSSSSGCIATAVIEPTVATSQTEFSVLNHGASYAQLSSTFDDDHNDDYVHNNHEENGSSVVQNPFFILQMDTSTE